MLQEYMYTFGIYFGYPNGQMQCPPGDVYTKTFVEATSSAQMLSF